MMNVGTLSVEVLHLPVFLFEAESTDAYRRFYGNQSQNEQQDFQDGR